MTIKVVTLIAWLNVMRLLLLMLYKLTTIWLRSNILSYRRKQDHVFPMCRAMENIFDRISQETALQVHEVLQSSKNCPDQETLVVCIQAIAAIYGLFLSAPSITIRALFLTLLELPTLLSPDLKLWLVRKVSQTMPLIKL